MEDSRTKEKTAEAELNSLLKEAGYPIGGY
jgi:hypothetical protein